MGEGPQSTPSGAPILIPGAVRTTRRKFLKNELLALIGVAPLAERDPQSKRSQVPSPVGAHMRQPIHVLLSHQCFSLFPSLYKQTNKISFSKKRDPAFAGLGWGSGEARPLAGAHVRSP